MPYVDYHKLLKELFNKALLRQYKVYRLIIKNYRINYKLLDIKIIFSYITKINFEVIVEHSVELFLLVQSLPLQIVVIFGA